MNNEAVYVTVEPYVYISTDNNSVFLYNTLNKKILESDSSAVIRLVNRLQRAKIPGIIKLSRHLGNHTNIRRFIEKGKQKFMVDLITVQDGGRKPVQFSPVISLQKDVEPKGSVYRFAGHGMNYLKNLSIFVNGRCDLDCGICRSAYRQFACCRRTAAPHRELAVESLTHLLQEVPHVDINILGGNIFKYSKFTALIELLKETKTAKSLYVHYSNLAQPAVDLNLLKHPLISLNVLIPFPLLQEELQNNLLLLKKKDIRFKPFFIVQSEKELIRSQQIAAVFHLEQFSFFPYYNGRNKTFFKKNIYIKKKNLLAAKPTIKEIFSRKVINRNYFGKLTVMTDGDVYANLNEKSIGNIETGPIRGLLYKELSGGRSWLRTRDKVTPCRECHYCFLCPSISNYDYAAGQYNLCTIWKEKKHETRSSGKEGT